MRGDGWAHYTKCPSVSQLSGSVPDVDPSSPALMLTSQNRAFSGSWWTCEVCERYFSATVERYLQS